MRGKLLTNKKQIAKLLAFNISQNPSTEHYSPCFQKIKTVKEKKRLNFSSDNQEEHNLPFSLTELKQSAKIQRFSHWAGDVVAQLVEPRDPMDSTTRGSNPVRRTRNICEFSSKSKCCADSSVCPTPCVYARIRTYAR